MNSQTIAVIPLRGGSKSIPRKNLLPFAGKPLFHWVALAAIETPAIDSVYIATDDAEIEASARSLNNPKIHVFHRSASTATDTASTESVLLELAEQVAAEQMILIQATSPLLTSEDLAKALEKYEEQGADSMLSVVRQKRFYWSETASGEAVPINYEPASRPRRQDFEGQLVENGAFYIFSAKGLRESECRLHGRMSIYEMSEASYFELDEPSDWLIAEGLMRNRQMGASTAEIRNQDLAKFPVERLRSIKLVLTDVDGVLTDAGMYYSEKGDELKKFNTRDAVGLRLLRESGIKVGIITSENTQIVQRRADKIGVDHLVQGAKNKAKELEYILSKTGFRSDEVAFIGDDVNDLSIIAQVGLSACPSDAQAAVRAKADVICNAKGGEGAVRELAEAILNSMPPEE